MPLLIYSSTLLLHDPLLKDFKHALNKEIDEPKNKISTLESALKNAANSFGESDKRTQAWQIQLNHAKAELNNMESSLAANNTELKAYAKTSDDSAVSSKKMAESFTEFGRSTEKGHASLRDIGSLLKDNIVTAARDAKTTVTDLGEKLKTGFSDSKEKIRETGSSILEFAKDTITGENNVKKLSDALANKLQSTLNRTEKDTDDLVKSLDDTGGEMKDTSKENKNLGDAMDDTGKKSSVFADVLKASLATDAI